MAGGNHNQKDGCQVDLGNGGVWKQHADQGDEMQITGNSREINCSPCTNTKSYRTGRPNRVRFCTCPATWRGSGDGSNQRTCAPRKYHGTNQRTCTPRNGRNTPSSPTTQRKEFYPGRCSSRHGRAIRKKPCPEEGVLPREV